MEFLIAIAFVIVFVLWIFNRRTHWAIGKPLSDESKNILEEKISFYRSLNDQEKVAFELKVSEFLANTKVTGIKTEVTETERILVAASAIIPIFSFPEWRYAGLKEVLLYPSSFDEKFSLDGSNKNILGMVGSGYMEGKMILSKQSLHLGFQNESDKKNVAIHEFIHLIDKRDGKIDGIPEVLMQKQYVLPWIDLVCKKMSEIHEGKSDINPYGGTKPEEFFTVAGEYFFERPELLRKKHPELFEMLSNIFNYKVRKTNFQVRETSRNAPCPCGSGMKFKRCCLT